MTGFGVAWRVLQAEGPRAFVARALDRSIESRRARSFVRRAGDAPPFDAPVLHLLATPLSPRLGGVQGQLLRRLEALAELGSTALLSPAGNHTYRLELARPAQREFQILRTTAGGLAGLLDAALDAAGASILQVEGLGGFTLEELNALRQHHGPLLLALHDFATFCRRPHLLESTTPAQFCHYSRDRARCRACLGRDWPELEAGFQERWRETTRGLLDQAAAVVYPSEFLRRAHANLCPGLDPGRQRVIAPAAHSATAGRPARHRTTGPLRHAALVGSVRVDKGALVFEEVAQQLAAASAPLRLSVLGGGDAVILRRLRRLPNVHVDGYYRQGGLPARLAQLGVELALLLSIVPESFALTLDECASASVPSLAFAEGALGDRVAESGGLLLPPPGDRTAAELTAVLNRMSRGELAVPEAPPAPRLETAQAAAAAWRGLHAGLAFATAR